MAMDPPPAPGASKPGASGTATNLSGPSQPKGGATQHADARARSASPPAHGSAANRIAPGQSQLQSPLSTEAVPLPLRLPAKRRGEIPISYDSSSKPSGLAPAAASHCKLWTYDVEVEKYVNACVKASRMPEVLESHHREVMDALQGLSRTFDGHRGAPGDARALAAAGIAAYSGVLQHLQTHGHHLKRLSTLRPQRLAAVSAAKRSLDVALQAVEARKAELEQFITSLKARVVDAHMPILGSSALGFDQRVAAQRQKMELELKHITEYLPIQAKEVRDAAQLEAKALADLEPRKAELAAEMTDVVSAMQGKFDAASLACSTDVAGGADVASGHAEAKLPIGLMDEISDRLGQLGAKGTTEMVSGAHKSFLMQVS